LGLQAKLLRVLEEGSFRRVGGLKDLPLDVRVIAASNRDLKSESGAGKFRVDLYYRLSVIQIDIPPLRERGDDVLLLAKYYLAHFNERLRKRIRGLAPEVEEIFRHYSWPGNVRELRNIIERVMILEDSDLITDDWLPRGLIGDEKTVSATPVVAAPQAAQVAITSFQMPITQSFQLPDEGIDLERVELLLVRQAMERSGGNQTRAAELLGVSRDQLRYRLKKIEEAHPE
jgi:transcriptional regulator with PAS, ATPase and Fis domain